MDNVVIIQGKRNDRTFLCLYGTVFILVVSALGPGKDQIFGKEWTMSVRSKVNMGRLEWLGWVTTDFQPGTEPCVR